MEVVAIFGPTASGKSAVALALAERLGGEIVSCDAMQLYRGLPILTNQPAAADIARAPHHLVGVWGTDHSGSVAEYAGLAHAAIDAVLSRGRTPVVCGGSGLYLRAALAEMPLPPQVPETERARFEELYDDEGAEAAHARLLAADPAAAVAVHPNDRRRVVRALELHAAGSSLAPGDDDRLWADDTRHATTVIGLDVPATAVAERIERRTGAMFAGGLVEEVRAARAAGPFSATAERIHGLQDVTDLLEGRIDRAEAERRLVVRTRRYAKRQRTWMRRIRGLRLVDADCDPAAAAADIQALL
ncbi:MAG TPA: tRNA (adenosine(37)-N6)-dimethylallyltransferase MiaA [Gaiellales bacterium]|nr:tRNA (adenosine(37)-N6)-dimethylallyltransferase MiaA [Gaiellales bacterium]